MIRVAIAGIAGRMGREVAALLATADGLCLVGGVVRPGGRAPDCDTRIVERPEQILPDADVLVDFTNPGAALRHALSCAAAGRAFVSGTTGLDPNQLAELREIARRVPVFHASNLSPGISALLTVLPRIAWLLDGYDVEIIETHHRHKRDAPSGTALSLAESLTGGSGLLERATYGRHGSAPRRPGEIGIHAVRAGGNAGEHAIILAGDDEQVTLEHRAFGRRAYARGALHAIRFVVGRPPGYYTTADLIASA